MGQRPEQGKGRRPGGISGRPDGRRPGNEDGPDVQIARLFCELRRAARLEPAMLESHLQTSGAILGALERGAINRFPPWPELERITRAYAALIGLDALPIIRKLSKLLYTPPPQRRYVKPAPDFAPSFRTGDSQSDRDVRTWEDQPGPRPEQCSVPPGPASDPEIPEDPLAHTHFDPLYPDAQAHAGAAEPEYYGHTAAEPPMAAEPGRAPAHGGPSLLKLIFVCGMLLVILCVIAYLAWLQGHHSLIVGRENETMLDALTRHFQALRELLR